MRNPLRATPGHPGPPDSHESCKIAIVALKDENERLRKHNDDLHARLMAVHGLGKGLYDRVLGRLSEQVERAASEVEPEETEPAKPGPGIVADLEADLPPSMEELEPHF